MPLRELDGPRREPEGRDATSLVVLLHGYGADGDDLITLADAWRTLLPAAIFLAPHAFDRLPGAEFGGRQWFPLTFRDPGELVRGTTAASPGLDGFLDLEITRYRLEPRRLALVGFSQGAMMALHVGLRRSPAPAAIIGYSGVMAGPEQRSDATASHPPVLLVHGERDEVIPVEALHLTREALARVGVPVEWHVRPGLGHGIDPEGLAYGGDFLKRVLAA
jgi:phospholipase/carboxylesterase